MVQSIFTLISQTSITSFTDWRGNRHRCSLPFESFISHSVEYTEIVKNQHRFLLMPRPSKIMAVSMNFLSVSGYLSKNRTMKFCQGGKARPHLLQKILKYEWSTGVSFFPPCFSLIITYCTAFTFTEAIYTQLPSISI